MANLIFFCFLFGLIANASGQCKVRYMYKKVCIQYSYNGGDCQPSNTVNCENSKTSYNDFKCPVYICDKVRIKLKKNIGLRFTMLCYYIFSSSRVGKVQIEDYDSSVFNDSESHPAS